MMTTGPGPSLVRPRGTTIVLVGVAIIFGAFLLFLAVSGASVGAAAQAMVRGAFGSRYALFSATLVRAIPLILTGLAVAWAFAAGVFNIGVEGQFIVGASAATATALAFPSGGVLSLLAALVAGATAGAAWAGVAAWLRVRFSVLEVISTIMLNFLAVQLLSYLVHGPLGDPKGIYPQSPSLSPATWMPRIIPGTRLHLGFVIAVMACAIAWFVRTRTAAGFRLRLVGANPHAARIAGRVSVDRVTTTAFLVSGAIAGLAGAVEVTGVTYALYESISPGYGYTAIAVALLANLNPAAVIVSGIGFGALEAGAAAMQRDAGVPAVIASVIEALIILVLATAQRRRWFSGDVSIVNAPTVAETT
jgi:general nucleoside transport system permease protein